MSGSCTPRYVRALDPWRCEGFDFARGSAELRRACFDQHGRRLPDRARAVVEFGGGGGGQLTLPVCRALIAYTALGKLSPPHLQSLVEELRGAIGARFGGDVAEGAAAVTLLFDSLGPGTRELLDDPMSGILTGVLWRAILDNGGGLVALLDRACALPEARAEAAIAATLELLSRARRGLLDAALRLADELPSLGKEEVRGTLEVAVEDAAAGTVVVRLPPGTPRPLVNSVGRMLESLSRDAVAAAELFGRARQESPGIVGEPAAELMDGLAGLLINARGRGRPTRWRNLTTRLEPAGKTPTRAGWCKQVALDGEPFRDALGRFFSAPHSLVILPRSGSSVVVWRIGTCPFADGGLIEASADAGHPAFLPAAGASPSES